MQKENTLLSPGESIWVDEKQMMTLMTMMTLVMIVESNSFCFL